MNYIGQALRVVSAIIIGYCVMWGVWVILHIRILHPYVLMILLMVATWWVLPRFVPWFTLNKRRVSASRRPLQIIQDGQWTIIDACASPLPWWHRVGMPVFLLTICALFIIGGDRGMRVFGIYMLLFSAALYVVLRHFLKKKRQANLPPFAVSREAIRLPDGEVIPRQRVYRYSMRNTHTGDNTIYVTTSAVQQLHLAANAAAARKLQQVSYAVAVEHDGTFSWLAGGLTEELANAVLREAAEQRS